MTNYLPMKISLMVSMVGYLLYAGYSIEQKTKYPRPTVSRDWAIRGISMYVIGILSSVVFLPTTEGSLDELFQFVCQTNICALMGIVIKKIQCSLNVSK